MEIIPAIDLKGGKCVRLYQGDYMQETIFSEDPVSVALKWQALGAKRLHLVDLDGAASGEPVNIGVIKKIIGSIKIPVQLGGGIRDEATVKKLLSLGVGRVILGTIAVEDPRLVEKLCRENAEDIVISIDARDGYVSTQGWLKETQVTAIELAQKTKKIGVSRILYTDIKRDGTLTEPNYQEIGELINKVKIPVIAAGGISRISHLEKLVELGAEAAVIGRAIYTGSIDLKKAFALSGNAK